MTEHKFTDEELIRKLNTVMFTKTEIVFPLTTDGTYLVLYLGDLVDLINRQKAEIESTIIDRNAARLGMIAEHERLKTAKAEAIKEFAERLRKNIPLCDMMSDFVMMAVDKTLKEMIGEEE